MDSDGIIEMASEHGSNIDSCLKGVQRPPASPYRGVQILLTALCLSLLFVLAVRSALAVLYINKSNLYDSLPHSNLSSSLNVSETATERGAAASPSSSSDDVTEDVRQVSETATERGAAASPSSSSDDVTEDVRQGCKTCAGGWLFHGGKCYFFSSEQMIWTHSRDHCISMGGHLVIITSQDEQDFLYSNTNIDTHWIGLNDIETEGQWVWVDSKPLNQTGVQFWHQRGDEKDEPDNWRGVDPAGENCASLGNYLGYTYLWFDASCKTMKKFVCETISAS